MTKPYANYFITPYGGGEKVRLCDWFESAMNRQRLSYKDVYEALIARGVGHIKAPGNVHNWRNGTARIPPEHIAALCAALRLSEAETSYMVPEVLRAYYPTLAGYILSPAKAA